MTVVMTLMMVMILAVLLKECRHESALDDDVMTDVRHHGNVCVVLDRLTDSLTTLMRAYIDRYRGAASVVSCCGRNPHAYTYLPEPFPSPFSLTLTPTRTHHAMRFVLFMNSFIYLFGWVCAGP